MSARIAFPNEDGTWTRVATFMPANNKFGMALKLFTVEDDETGEQKVSKSRINRFIAELKKIRDAEPGSQDSRPFLPVFPDTRQHSQTEEPPKEEETV